MGKKWLKANIEMVIEINENMTKEGAARIVELTVEGINKNTNDANSKVMVLPGDKFYELEGDFDCAKGFNITSTKEIEGLKAEEAVEVDCEGFDYYAK